MILLFAMNNYEIVSTSTLQDIMKLVNQKLSEGYEIVGGVQVLGIPHSLGVDIRFFQTLVKNENKKTRRASTKN
jgi:hypothetical protein